MNTTPSVPNTSSSFLQGRSVLAIIYPGEFTKRLLLNFDGASHEDILERVFAEWNAGSRRECEAFVNSRVRSLSVNDIVGIDGCYYQCASAGWVQVSVGYVIELEQAVRRHPLYVTYGGHAALDAVVWSRRSRKDLDI